MEETKTIVKQSLVLTLLLVGIGVGVVATRDFVLPLIKAEEGVSGIDLKPPYMRLGHVKQSGDEVMVDVLVNTAGSTTLAADVVISYDESVIEPVKGSVAANEYEVLLVNKADGGRVDFSVFSNPERDEPVVKTRTNEEVVIASLKFVKKIEGERDISLELVYEQGKLDDSNLIGVYSDRPEKPVDILREVGGVAIVF